MLACIICTVQWVALMGLTVYLLATEKDEKESSVLAASAAQFPPPMGLR
jgi:hypothetical protein